MCFAIISFSQVSVNHLEPTHAQSPFLFPLVFGVNMIPFLDGRKEGEAVHSIICLRFQVDRLSGRYRETEQRMRTISRRKV